jgi:hypothetical protein
VVRWLVLRAENGAADDAANTSGTDECGRAKSAFPLASDVVGLPGEDTGN